MTLTFTKYNLVEYMVVQLFLFALMVGLASIIRGYLYFNLSKLTLSRRFNLTIYLIILLFFFIKKN